LINTAKEMLIYAPMSSDASKPLFICVKGTNSPAEAMLDFHLFAKWLIGGSTLFDAFEVLIFDAAY